MDYTVGVCFVFAVECHFSSQEIMCRREEELEDDKVIKIFRKIVLFFIFFPPFLIAESHRMWLCIDLVLKCVFGVSDSPAGPTDVQKNKPMSISYDYGIVKK